MTERLKKSYQKAFDSEHRSREALLKMQQIFDKYQQNDAEKLFSILKAVAADARNIGLMALDKYRDMYKKVPEVYWQSIEAPSALERRYFMEDEPDVLIPEYNKDFVGVGFDSSKGNAFVHIESNRVGREFVSIDGNKVYEPSDYKDDSRMPVYVCSVSEALEQFEKLKEEALSFLKTVDDAIKDYKTDKAILQRLDAFFSKSY